MCVLFLCKTKLLVLAPHLKDRNESGNDILF